MSADPRSSSTPEAEGESPAAEAGVGEGGAGDGQEGSHEVEVVEGGNSGGVPVIRPAPVYNKKGDVVEVAQHIVDAVDRFTAPAGFVRKGSRDKSFMHSVGVYAENAEPGSIDHKQQFRWEATGGWFNMNRPYLWVGLEAASEFVPFTDIVSDIVLLVSVWRNTEVYAPDDVDGCGERALWYLALAFTVIGTLVDLFPEMLLVSEVILHPGVFSSRAAVCTLLRMLFSDGKPVVVFAANEDEEKPLHPPLQRIRDSLRRRLASVAASFFMRDGCMGGHSPKWTYAGLVGILVGGEAFTAVGACLFLRIEFGWPAVASLVASVLALLISTRCHLRNVGDKELHLCHESFTGNGGRLFEFLLPGPVSFARFLLLVPVWPIFLVYSESANFWPFSMANEGDHSRPVSEDARWVSPNDWLRVQVPTLGVSDNDSPLSYLYWAIVPHLLWALASTIRVGLMGTMRLFCWYFGHTEDWSAHAWGVYFASQESPFHEWSRKIQGALGMGFTFWVATEFRRLFVFSIVFAALVVEAYNHGACVEQEWAFLFAHAAWWGIMLIGHMARRKNIFRSISDARAASVQGTC